MRKRVLRVLTLLVPFSLTGCGDSRTGAVPENEKIRVASK